MQQIKKWRSCYDKDLTANLKIMLRKQMAIKVILNSLEKQNNKRQFHKNEN